MASMYLEHEGRNPASPLDVGLQIVEKLPRRHERARQPGRSAAEDNRQRLVDRVEVVENRLCKLLQMARLYEWHVEELLRQDERGR